ncbi:C40 family peptidase [Escherichia sp. E2593]|uniref:C40 family peptidase n=1 Tax=Escherichia sp. E2593 TaxID=2044458 RepID=UPI0034645EA2
MAQLGKPYRWGGASPETGFDCSGLIWYAWRKNFHITLPRTAAGMYSMPQAHHVPYMLLQPGDMVFFSIHGERVDHVGVYVGNGHFIEAPHTGQKCQNCQPGKRFLPPSLSGSKTSDDFLRRSDSVC